MIVSRRKRWRKVFGLIIVFLFLIYYFCSKTSKSYDIDYVPKNFTIVIEGSDQNLGSKKREAFRETQTKVNGDEKLCHVPKLDINAAEIMHLFGKNQETVCDSDPNWAFIDLNGKFAQVPSRASANCQIQPFTWKTDESLNYGDWIEIKQGDRLPSDFAKVYCKIGFGIGRHTWTGLLMSIVRKENVVQRAMNGKQPTDWSGLNVYLLGIDSMSRLNFLRKLPKTVAYFEQMMGGVVLDAYNIVGDGTPQAYIPITTGQTEEELPLARKRFSNAKYVDEVYPFIWKNFSDAGYVTLFGEDTALFGMFTYRLKGFRHLPTDHHITPYFQQHEKELGFFDPGLCAGSAPVYQSWFRYCKEFVQVYSDVARFSVMHMALFSHDDINLIAQIDDTLEAHLREMHESGQFDRTLVVLNADHGVRFEKFRATHQGQLEERLPFFAFALPKELREGKMKTAWENLVRNKDILSTPFDIHATFSDILHWPSEKELTTVQEPTKRSLSLFRPLPISRTCEQAGVAPHWCTCLNWENVMEKEGEKDLVEQMANSIVSAINMETKPERALCAPLFLKTIVEAKRMIANEALLKYNGVKDADGFVPNLSRSANLGIIYYQFKLITTPGDALYEVTLRYETATAQLFIDLHSISHVNRYGDRPHCIIEKNYFLATYCVCYDKI